MATLKADLEQCRTPAETMRTIRRGMHDLFGSRPLILLSTRGLSDGEYRVVQLHLDGYDAGDSDPWTRQEAPIHRGGVIAAILKNPSAQIVTQVDWTGDPLFNQRLAEYASILAIPVSGQLLPITWALILKRATQRITRREFEETVLRTAIIGSLLESQALALQLARVNQQIDQDAEQVGDLQRALLPRPLPEIPGLEIAASYQPCGRAGGDLYDLFPLDDAAPSGRWCVLLADASGHGLAAAVVTTMVQAILRAHPLNLHRAGDLLAHANRQLCRKKIRGFVTAFLGIYQPSTGNLEYACAGHPPPLMKHAGGNVSRLDAVASCPLGIINDESWAHATIRIGRGDMLLFYTDGITEAWDPDDDMFSEERLRFAFDKCVENPARLIEHLKSQVSAFRRGRPQADDQTLVAIRGI